MTSSSLLDLCRIVGHFRGRKVSDLVTVSVCISGQILVRGAFARNALDLLALALPLATFADGMCLQAGQNSCESESDGGTKRQPIRAHYHRRRLRLQLRLGRGGGVLQVGICVLTS